MQKNRRMHFCPELLMDNSFEQIWVASLGKWGTARCVASSPEAAQGLVLNQFGKELHILAMQRILTHLSWAIFPESPSLSYLSWSIYPETSLMSYLSWVIFHEVYFLSSWAIFPYYLSFAIYSILVTHQNHSTMAFYTPIQSSLARVLNFCFKGGAFPASSDTLSSQHLYLESQSF